MYEQAVYGKKCAAMSVTTITTSIDTCSVIFASAAASRSRRCLPLLPPAFFSSQPPVGPRTAMAPSRTPPSAAAKKAAETLLAETLSVADPSLVRALKGDSKAGEKDETSKFLRTL